MWGGRIEDGCYVRDIPYRQGVQVMVKLCFRGWLKDMVNKIAKTMVSGCAGYSEHGVQMVFIWSWLGPYFQHFFTMF